jgi:hypothetical protein
VKTDDTAHTEICAQMGTLCKVECVKMNYAKNITNRCYRRPRHIVAMGKGFIGVGEGEVPMACEGPESLVSLGHEGVGAAHVLCREFIPK